MAQTTTTTFINLTLPTPTVRLGPTWATDINAAFELVDSHDHTSGKGKQIPTAGLSIDDDLDFNNNKLETVEAVKFQAVLSSPTGSSFAAGISVFAGNLYYTNSSGIAVQITSGGSLVASPASIESYEVQNVATSLTISPSDTFVYMTVDTTASRVITLPLANAVSTGRIYIIKDKNGLANTNNITIAAAGSDLVDGAATVTLDSNYGSWTVVGDGVSNFYVS